VVLLEAAGFLWYSLNGFMKYQSVLCSDEIGAALMELDHIQIQRESGIPIAEQIANQMLKSILDGNLDPGERLPTERDLALALGVSRGTVKRAYAKLSQSEAIDIRQGSGSYVLHNGHVLEQNQKKEAADVIAGTFERLRGMGLSEKEIFNLVNLHYLGASRKNSIRKISIMVVSNNYDILSDLEQQLSYLTYSSPFLFTLSFLTLDTIASNADPVQVLLGYDLVIASSIDYPAVMRIAPMFRHKTLEATISPRTRTLVELSALPPHSRFSVLYKTETFRDMVVRCLLSLGFHRENIFCCLYSEYNPVSHSDNGVNAVINYNESPLFLDQAFAERNRIFTEQGGHILRFHYQIERSSLVFIEDQIQKLIQNGDRTGG